MSEFIVRCSKKGWKERERGGTEPTWSGEVGNMSQVATFDGFKREKGDRELQQLRHHCRQAYEGDDWSCSKISRYK